VGRLLLLIVAACALAACGEATSGPNTDGAAPPPPATGANTVTISPFGGSSTATETAAAEPVFPAETPSGVLDLAAQHPDGIVTYAILHEGAQGEMTIARLGGQALVAITTGTGTTKVGVDVEGPAITWVCTTPTGEDPTCTDKDEGGRGADALATAAALVGEDRVRELVAAASATSDANVVVRTQAQVDASCVTGTNATGGLAICISPSGFVTDAEGGGAIARAIAVSPDVTDADLAQPA
jgi:hypothetical protein